MKTIKTYEGFFDFLKKKKSTEPIYIEDIKDCITDITDDYRIENSLDVEVNNGIYHSYSDVLGKKNSSFDSDYEQLGNEISNLPEYIRDNVMAIRISYNYRNISNDEIKRKLEIASSKLKTYDCITTFYLAWGRDEGGSIDKEYKTVDKLFREINSIDRHPNITIKITAPSKIIFNNEDN